MTRNETDDHPAPGTKRQRIAKLMARSGLCSRRDAEAWIVAGRVSVNGIVLTSPALDVTADDAIFVDGTPLPVAEKSRLFLFHKPRGLVTSDRDPEGRETVADYLRENWPEGPRVVTVGRLDINTEGLLLLTNDGGLARVLELPQTGWVRRYRVRAKGQANPAALDALAAGITIDGTEYAGIEARLDRVQGANCWLTMGLREGKNREIKRVLEHLGLEVNRLIRLSFGPFQLLDLPEGAVEEVRTRVLRDQLGPSLVAQAGALFEEREADPPGEERPRERRAKGHDRTGRSASDKARMTTHGREPGELPPRQSPSERQRPAPGPRKHISTIRAAERHATQGGPRKRIERSSTQDHRDRTVTVERLVPSRGDRDLRRPMGRDDPKRKGRDRRDRKATSPADDRRQAARRDGQRRNESPSARGKRERVSRSGGRRDDPATERGANPGRNGPRRPAAKTTQSRTGPRSGGPPRNKSRGPSKPKR